MRHPAQLLKAHSLYASKRRGQNYLCQPATAEAIVRLAGVGPQDTVVEIGAGLGALTLPLAAVAGQVIALEIDRGIFKVLEKVLEDELSACSNVELRLMDALDFDWAQLPAPVKVVGNLPYAISSPLLFTLLQNMPAWQSSTLMLQKELAERLSTAPGSKTYGRLSVLVQSLCHVQEQMVVGPHNFFPSPAVDSLVFTLTPRQTPLVAAHEQVWFSQVVKAAFAQRRKTLLNSLGAGLSMARGSVLAGLEQAGLKPSLRAESLSIEQLASLARALSERD